MSRAVIITNPARCRDCYRCVRNCEVKAIRVQEGQAQVVPEFCIVCGTCIRACPQKAKGVASALPMIRQAQADGKLLIASVAPSAPAYFAMETFARMEEALKLIGFHAAQETAIGAEIVGLAHGEYVEKAAGARPVITSSCPVVVNMIEQYHPDLIPHLAPIVSPMIAHGRMLRKQYGPDAYIVFIGPCLAKKAEIEDEAVKGAIDAAMTFRGLQECFNDAGIALSPSETLPDTPLPVIARLFPIEGGLIGTAGGSTDVLNNRIVVTTGLEGCQDVLNDIRAGQLDADLVELMACKGGCINGPAMVDVPGGIFAARQKIIRYYEHNKRTFEVPHEEWPLLERTYSNRKQEIPKFSEEQIREVLQRVNKYTEDDELNCGACGYSSCREKAVATLRGMAEATMCIPYMRRRSESLRQVVMDVSPNSILILDETLKIQDMSPSAEKLFRCMLDDMKGRPLATLLSNIQDFIEVRNSGIPIIGRVRELRDGLVAEENIVYVKGQSLIVGIIRDITERDAEEKKFNALKAEMMERTREVVKKQMRVAHEIAHLLGETTAESKMIVTHLTKLLEEEALK